MKHKKEEWYTCDRCGAYIKNVPSLLPKIPFTRTELIDIKTCTASIDRYLSGPKPMLENVCSMDIVEYYKCKEKRYNLCGKCRKEFKRWIKNGGNGHDLP